MRLFVMFPLLLIQYISRFSTWQQPPFTVHSVRQMVPKVKRSSNALARLKSNSCLGWIISCRTIYQLQRKKKKSIQSIKKKKKNSIVSHQLSSRYKGPIICKFFLFFFNSNKYLSPLNILQIRENSLLYFLCLLQFSDSVCYNKQFWK